MVDKSDGVLPLVTPAQAGVHILSQVKPGTSPSWIPASAGMTESGDVQSDRLLATGINPLGFLWIIIFFSEAFVWDVLEFYSGLK
jgi:hypothetical protein